MINERIYKIDYRKLVVLLLPTVLRKTRLVAYLQALISAVVYVYNSFISYRNETNYWLGINSQVCYLEKMLNDRYDPFERRIFINKGDNKEAQYIFLEAEENPLYTFTEAESMPVYLFLDSETVDMGVDFVVMVPQGLQINEIELNALVNANALPDKTHSIQRF